MSITVERLTKEYGRQKVLDAISFDAPKGKITGFLGPNGAGKSTTMKIATSYIHATSGAVFIQGINSEQEALKTKQLTGYLPEHNPLYLEMYVKEYLKFIGDSYKIKNVKKHIGEMIALCGLEVEQHKKIRVLSKGYRQRVGLAQALIHNPKILILDEPTSGLDPNQLVEIRNVIKEVSKEKTVLLSTHIMQEVEALCDKVVIINKGKIVADDTVEHLKKTASNTISYTIEFESKIDDFISHFKPIEIKPLAESSYLFSAKEDPREMIMKIVGDYSLPLRTISRENQSLERIFQELTKKG